MTDKKGLDTLTGKRPVGKPRHWPTPESMWADAEAYFQHIDDNPGWNYAIVGGKQVIAKTRAPYTILGFCNYCEISFEGYREYKNRPEYSAVITRIETKVRDQQLSGAMMNHFNSNIVARLLGLADKHEVKSHARVTDTSKTREAVKEEAAKLGVDLSALGLDEED